MCIYDFNDKNKQVEAKSSENPKSKKPQIQPAFLVWLSNYHKQLSRIKKNPKRRQSQHLALRGVYLSSFFSELRGTSHTCDYNVRHYLLSSKQIGKQTETATAARKGEVCKTQSLTNKDFSTSQDAA